MDAFSYLATLFSVILGLAVTQILTGLRALMLARARVIVYWPSLIWAGTMFLLITQDWWAMFGLETVKVWTFASYAVVLLMVTMIYLVSGLAVPDIEHKGTIDMRADYFAHARWFFLLLAACVPVSLAKDLVIAGQLTNTANLAFHFYFFAGALIAAFTKSRWFHAVFAPVSAAIFVVYVVMLFARL